MKIVIFGCLLRGPPGNPRGVPAAHKSHKTMKTNTNYLKCTKWYRKTLNIQNDVEKATNALRSYKMYKKTAQLLETSENTQTQSICTEIVTKLPKGYFCHSPSFSTYIVKEFLHLFLLAMAVDTNNSITPRSLFRTHGLSNFRSLWLRCHA